MMHDATWAPPARPLRVVVIGSESTGKTTLARDLAAHFGAPWSPEHVRAYLDAKASPLDAADVEPIARGQLAIEDEATARATAGSLVILDTDLNSTVVYARHYYDLELPWLDRAARERRAELYLLADVDVPWVADPQRDLPHLRAHMHALFRRRLVDIGARVVEIRGAWPERFARARAAIDALRREHGSSAVLFGGGEAP